MDYLYSICDLVRELRAHDIPVIWDVESERFILNMGHGGPPFAFRYLKEKLGEDHVHRMVNGDHLSNCHLVLSQKPVSGEICSKDLPTPGFFVLILFTNWNLDIIREAERFIKLRYGTAIDTEDSPYDDVSTMELLEHGDTGDIPFFESEAMKAFLPEWKPRSLKSLTVLNALLVPGRMDLIPDTGSDGDFSSFRGFLRQGGIINKTLIAYRMAWLKAHYRNEFYLAVRKTRRRIEEAAGKDDDYFEN